MNLEAEARARRLTAVLEEVVGGGAPRDLATRIAQRLRGTRPQTVAPRLLAALLMLGGVAVVVATSRWQSDVRPAVAPQEPAAKQAEVRKVTVTTAMVRAACEVIDAPPPGDGVARLLELANRGKLGIVVAPGVHGTSKAALDGLTSHEAVCHIAAELGVGVAEFGTVVVVGLGDVVPVERLRCSFPAGRPAIDVRDLPRVLDRIGLDLVVAADVSGQVVFDVASVPVRALLDVVAAQLSLQVVGCGSVLALRRATPLPAPARQALNLKDRSILDAIDLLAHVAQLNVVIGPAVQGVVSVRTLTPDTTDLLVALTAAVGADVRGLGQGILHAVPRLTLPASLTQIAGPVTLRDVAKAAEVADLVVIPDGDERRVELAVSHAPVHDVLRAIAVATGRRWVRSERTYAVE
jgi:hypothetical protein